MPLVACHSHTTKLLQRCSRPLCSSQGTGGTTPVDDRVHLRATPRCGREVPFEGRDGPRGAFARDPSGPNSVPDYDARSASLSTPASWLYLRADQTSAPNSRRSTNEQRRLETFARETTTGQHAEACCRWLLRKEDPAAPSGTATLLRLRPNRQPHLRRLPPQGLGHRLRVLPTFVT